MAVIITGALPHSAAQKLNIAPGSRLVAVNGHATNDLLDYGFYTAACELRLEIEDPAGEIQTYFVQKQESEELGFVSQSFLMDSQRGCRNHCIFCFIDQLPPGLRETLYFKDDDERLSFLYGNYITLTNLSDADVERIIAMRIAPMNISVHTTDPALRCRMMGNPKAGEALRHLYRLAGAGIALNAQIVLCRGLNDGPMLEATLTKLESLWPALRSVACVPVGLTGHRGGLTPLEPYDAQSAREVLEIIDRHQATCRARHGVGLIYPADEWLCLAGRPIPPPEFYDGYPQLENGVGMLAAFREEFLDELNALDPIQSPPWRGCPAGLGALAPPRGTDGVVLITGTLAAPFMRGLICEAQKKHPRIACDVIEVENRFFGGRVSVSGLLTAADILARLETAPAGGYLLLPRNVLRREGDMLLDSVTVEKLAERAGRPVHIVDGGAELANVLTAGLK